VEININQGKKKGHTGKGGHNFHEPTFCIPDPLSLVACFCKIDLFPLCRMLEQTFPYEGKEQTGYRL
jgi:hypothetical protein